MIRLLQKLRGLPWRIGRTLYCRARGDGANDPRFNGEYWLVRQVLGLTADAGVFLDVGANRGEWTAQVLGIAHADRRAITVFAFEPSAATRTMLYERLAGQENVEVCALALSSAIGEADFFSNVAGGGTNSLSSISGPVSERVAVTTIDAFMTERAIDHVTMVKIDTEGFDLNVLQGAACLIADGKADVVQFEYNWRWLLNRASLRQVFELVEKSPFRVGKLRRGYIEIYDSWHFELDRYFENNYVLVRRGSCIERSARLVTFDASNVLVPLRRRLWST